MIFVPLSPKQSINKAFLKEKVSRADVDLFKFTTQSFFNNTKKHTGDEALLKTQIIFWLRDTWFKEDFHITPIDKNDLAIHIGKGPSEPLGVIIETKSKDNKNEMISLDRPNEKAFHELVLYYFRQRIDHGNNELKHLIATNIDEWFLFDANEFDKKIFRNSSIKKIYDVKKNDHKDNPWFYSELKNALRSQNDLTIECTHININSYHKQTFSNNNDNDNQLIALYKTFSPINLLKRPFANDSNSLQPKFYTELLHIIGLVEEKDGGKKIIKRKAKDKRDDGSLLENTINCLESHDKLSRIDQRLLFGTGYQEQIFHIALELVITWINRILFLKLLEAQLGTYHQSDRNYRFLDVDKIKDFDDLDKVFFSVLARKPEERREEIQRVFEKVPYLNSSLFEPTDLEHQTFFINALDNRLTLPVISSTVLKDDFGKKLKGGISTIAYLFAFLDAYDFSSEGAEDIQEDNKALINASVLGLIFEKINGYKDGSFFTPGFVTMSLCRQTIRGAILAKFNATNGWKCQSINQLYDLINDRNQANEIINSLKICDPAVGSGHFLVSALNEIIAVKSDLKILSDRTGRRLKEYQVEVVNDELVVIDEESKIFQYNPKSAESQRVQEALFHEKQTIIENCLFGVDINPNSVKICRLRLWIELLKHTYYRIGHGKSGLSELETLPNIDINIKSGNSLISRFPLDVHITQALKEGGERKRSVIKEYREAVFGYKNAKDKTAKQKLIYLIEEFKNGFRTEISKESKDVKNLAKAEREHFLKYESTQLFNEELTKAQLTHKENLLDDIRTYKQNIENIKNNSVYLNAFEWRFEFPEILDDDGNFVGFDVVVGNPPYDVIEKDRNNILEPYKDMLDYCASSKRYIDVEGGKLNLYRLFIKLASEISKGNANFGFIVPLTLVADNSLANTRRFLLEHLNFGKFECFPQKDNPSKRIFEDAKQSTVIVTGVLTKARTFNNQFQVNTYPGKSFDDEHKHYSFNFSDIESIDKNIYPIPLVSETEWRLLQKVHREGKSFKDEDAIKLRRGEINQTILRRFITKIPTDMPLVKGVQIGQYRIKEKLSQGEKEYFTESEYTSSGAVNPLKKIRRIATQRITGVDERLRLVATIIDFDSYFADSTNSVHVLEDQVPYDTYFILGLLNSKLYQWRFKKTSTNNNVSTTELAALPFKYDKVLSALISKEVRALIEDAEIQTHAQEIDRLVYELFMLDNVEINIIEHSAENIFVAN